MMNGDDLLLAQGTGVQRMREMRQELKAEARISKEMAGTDTKVQEAEFLEYARKSQASAEFDSLIGLAGSTTPEKPKADKPTALPE